MGRKHFTKLLLSHSKDRLIMPEGIIGIKGNYIKHRLVCCNQRAGKSRRDKQLAGSQFRSNRKNQEGKT